MNGDRIFGGGCPYCSAGAHNDNQHDKNCMANLPDLQEKGKEPSYATILAAWLAGWEDRDFSGNSPEEVDAYNMGLRLRAKAPSLGTRLVA